MESQRTATLRKQFARRRIVAGAWKIKPMEETQMTYGRKLLTIVLGLATVAVVSPVLAQQNQGFPIGAARAAAVHQCSVREAKFLDRLWGVTEVQIYRACMSNHGQVE